MHKKDPEELIRTTGEWYFQIGSIACPAFSGEQVYFNKHGWRHLLRKGRNPRSLEQQIKRMNLLQYAPYILARSANFNECKEIIIDNRSGWFWAFRRYVENISIRIVVRQIGNGPKHFFSIMNEDEKTSR